MDKPHLLIVDDDREIRDLLSRFLTRHGCRVSVAVDGREMWQVLDQRGIDLVVLDLMLPGEDGLSLCRRLRVASDLPVIMLTARGEDIDRIVGLEMGADDYLAKPFNPHELLARSRAVLRRTRRIAPVADRLVEPPAPVANASAGAPGAMAAYDEAAKGAVRRVERLRFAGWRLDLAARELHSPEDVLVPLSAGEFALLAAFATHPQRVLSRDQLLDLARGREAQPFDRAIDVQVSRLRRKIEADPREPVLIKTVRAGGYLFAARVEAE